MSTLTFDTNLNDCHSKEKDTLLRRYIPLLEKKTFKVPLWQDLQFWTRKNLQIPKLWAQRISSKTILFTSDHHDHLWSCCLGQNCISIEKHSHDLNIFDKLNISTPFYSRNIVHFVLFSHFESQPISDEYNMFHIGGSDKTKTCFIFVCIFPCSVSYI